MRPLLLQRAGKIDDRAAGIAGAFPILPRALRVGREESEIDVGKLLGADALDEVDFVARRFELADRFVVIEQANVDRGKIALIQHLGNFLAFQRSRAHDGHAE